jgi:hypothetical protein
VFARGSARLECARKSNKNCACFHPGEPSLGRSGPFGPEPSRSLVTHQMTALNDHSHGRVVKVPAGEEPNPGVALPAATVPLLSTDPVTLP